MVFNRFFGIDKIENQQILLKIYFAFQAKQKQKIVYHWIHQLSGDNAIL